MTRTVVAVVLAAAALAGCGGGGGRAQQELRETAQRLGTIHSGTLLLRLVVTPLGASATGRIGFALAGPFSFRPGALPVAKITYTQLAGPHAANATFVSTGKTAYAVVGGRRVALPQSALAEIRGAAGGITGGGRSSSALRIDSWLDHPHISAGGVVGGADTDRISAGLDVVDAANGLLSLVRSLGRATPTITGSSADELRKSVKSSSIDVWTGKHDKLLRRLEMKARLGFGVPEELKRALGTTVGANVEFELAITNPNRPIRFGKGTTR